MRLVAARITPFRLRLTRPLATAHGRLTRREAWLIELRSRCGHSGFGEAAPLPGFRLEGHCEAGRALDRAASRMLGLPADEARAELNAFTPAAPAARAALDVALHDLLSRAAGLPLCEWLARREGRSSRARVGVAALLAAAPAEAAAAEALRRVAAGYTTLKLKLAAADFSADLERVVAVREAVPPGTTLRLDANGAWKEADAEARIASLSSLDIELLEQPLPADDVAGLLRLCAGAPFPVAADESVRDVASATRLLDASVPPWLVLKPAALGGLRAAGQTARLAERAGTRSVVTSFLDSAIGRSAALHFAASLPEGPAAGLATGSLLESDLSAPERDAGILEVPSDPGLGFSPDPERLARCASANTIELRA